MRSSNKIEMAPVMISNVFADENYAPKRPRILPTLLLTLFSACAWSQTQLATVFGTMNDPSGAVIPGAQVTIVNQSTGLKRATLTDMTGRYRLAGLQPGNYALRTEKEGFQTQVREGIGLTPASEVMINLSLAIGAKSEHVTVSAAVTAIDNTTSTIGGTVAERSLIELPLNGRDLFNAAHRADMALYLELLHSDHSSYTEVVESMFEPVGFDLLVLDHIRIEPEHRGHRYGLYAAELMINSFAPGDGLVACIPAPYELLKGRDAISVQQAVETTRDGRIPEWKPAEAKLRRHRSLSCSDSWSKLRSREVVLCRYSSQRKLIMRRRSHSPGLMLLKNPLT
jgi:hypothetical protein